MSTRLLWTAILASPALWVWLSRQPANWSALAPDPCRSLNCYGEPIGAGFVSQPLATFSNVVFLMAAAGLMATRSPGRGLAGALLVTAWGSFFYHASLTRVGEWFDLMGSYLPLTVLLVRNAERDGVVAADQARPIGAALLAVGGLQMVVARELQQVVFATLATGLIAVDLTARRRTRAAWPRPWWRAAIGALAVGAFVWLADGQGLLPRPTSLPAPWHALWHGCAALAVYCAGRDAGSRGPG